MKHLGVDVGSISVNTVLLNNDKDVIEEFYDYSHGRPFQTLANRLSSILKKHPDIMNVTGMEDII